MSLPPHREKDAKVEGRDQPETVRNTMTPFRRLMVRLLNVPMGEVEEQQRLYRQERKAGFENATKAVKKRRARVVSHVADGDIAQPQKPTP